MTRRIPLAPLALACLLMPLAPGATDLAPSSDPAGAPVAMQEQDKPVEASADKGAVTNADSAKVTAAKADADLAADSDLRAQVLLERAHFSPGVIDGVSGSNTRRAIAAYQAANDLDASGRLDDATWASLRGDQAPILIEHTLSDDDVAGPFRETPASTEEMAALDGLPYESVEEKVAEQFHITPSLLAKHNPGTELKVGSNITVPYVSPATNLPTPAKVVVDKSDSVLQLHDADGKVIAQFPVTTGSAQFPLPIGEWKIQAVARNPVWYFDPALIAGTAADAKKAEIPPGPNNPVGVVWIDLSKEHYGIHGTPEPSKIGKTASNGCIRMTNWSALAVAKVVASGMTASLRE